MLIITNSNFLKDIVLSAHSMSVDVSETISQEVIAALDDEVDQNSHQGKLYCWTGNDAVPSEAEAIMGYKDLCAEEYEFDSLEEGDVVYMYSEHSTDEGDKVAWHVITFDDITR